MNVFQESCCSILGVLLVFLLQGSCSDPGVVHKAVGESLELIADYPKDGLEVQWTYNENVFAEFDKYIKPVGSQSFLKRLKMNEDNISVTVEDLKRQDSGSFSMVARAGAVQHKTKIIELHVHELIRDVQIEYNVSKLQSENICTFHLRCLASGDPNPSYSWSGHQIQTQGPHLNISLRPAENATLTCTANNTYSVNYTTETVVCREKLDYSSVLSGFPLKYLLIAVGAGIVVVVIFGATLAVCCRRRSNKGQGESEAGITVYEEVNTDGPAKKRSESVANGMSIYETVNDTKLSQNLPQTLYDKINYQRHPAVSTSTSTSSPYQEVL
ncbi:signaling lymphocytic activation molecule [Cyprinus carpio]|uniref:Signaling lymphocytic activation molecule n=1 Tax=Cyprinus carpio TaxID=7962 RepID=A0A9Q9WG17_CYPCA|nr:signaling lymphocytic activation molecule [Cyprinus carpio]